MKLPLLANALDLKNVLVTLDQPEKTSSNGTGWGGWGVGSLRRDRDRWGRGKRYESSRGEKEREIG